MPATDPTVLGTVLENIGGLGSAGAIVALLVYLIRSGGSDRTAYQAALAAAENRHTAEMDRMRERVDGLERQVQELTAALDAERRRRWHAEDAAADAMRAMGQTGG